jgi:hypothetical protein
MIHQDMWGWMEKVMANWVKRDNYVIKGHHKITKSVQCRSEQVESLEIATRIGYWNLRFHRWC